MLAAIGLAALSAAPARATDITGSPLTVNVTDRGVTHGYMTNGDIDTFPRQFSTGGGVLRFRLADGTTLYDFDARPLTQGPVVRRGAEQTQETTYRLGPFQILETTTLRDGDMGYRAEWAVQNLSGAPVRYRAAAMGNIDGTVVYEAGSAALRWRARCAYGRRSRRRATPRPPLDRLAARFRVGPHALVRARARRWPAATGARSGVRSPPRCGRSTGSADSRQGSAYPAAMAEGGSR